MIFFNPDDDFNTKTNEDLVQVSLWIISMADQRTERVTGQTCLVETVTFLSAFSNIFYVYLKHVYKRFVLRYCIFIAYRDCIM